MLLLRTPVVVILYTREKKPASPCRRVTGGYSRELNHDRGTKTPCHYLVWTLVIGALPIFEIHEVMVRSLIAHDPGPHFLDQIEDLVVER